MTYFNSNYINYQRKLVCAVNSRAELKTHPASYERLSSQSADFHFANSLVLKPRKKWPLSRVVFVNS